ncbi:toll-like receptor 2 [Mytilus galloprovincialis]|uniref:toll-like receptor 2 n=1 Tax=Mytilus galloprovincialis TaxID=29158 RepID=UPI003F7BC868
MKMNQIRRMFLLFIMLTILHGNHAMPCTYSRNRNHKLIAHCENQGFNSVPRNLSRNISELILSNNSLRMLENDSFVRYTKMEVMILSKNFISEIQEDAFVGLHLLKVLKVNDNLINITTLSNGVFRHLSNLIDLDISRNKKSLHENTAFVYPDGAFSTLRSLQNLSIDLFMFPEFGAGFSSLKNLTVLKFSQCYLRNSSRFRLSNSTFEHFSANLKELYMSGCRNFFLLEYGILEYFPNLKILDLSESYVHLYQALRILHPFQYKNMSVINFHHISDNSINEDDFPYSVVLTAELMTYLRTICIEALDLSKTGIVDFKHNSLLSFEHPECFKTFIISANRLPTTTAKHSLQLYSFFMKAINIKVYDVSYLTIDYAHPVFINVYNTESFYHLPKSAKYFQMSPHWNINYSLPSSIEFLRFTHVQSTPTSAFITCKSTSLKYLDVSYGVYKRYPKFSEDCLKQLEYLDISGISVAIITFPPMLLPKLVVLKMTNARIDQIVRKGREWMSFRAPVLREVDISFNNIWTLEETTFFEQPHITHLNMSNNLFRTIPNFVTKLQKLEYLDLSNNLITSIDDNIRLWLDKIIHLNPIINLDNNAFVCSCDTLDFLLWFEKTNVTFYNGDNYTCTMSNNKQILLKEVAKNTNKYFADCNATLWLHVGIILVASAFGIFVPLSLLYNYRWNIILYMYRKVRRVVEKNLHENYIYDAYVSYEERSVLWIQKCLLPKIEEEWGLKVFLHDRDLLPGHITADAKAESIQQSRHVVFIITEHFTEGKWGRFEIDRAKYEKYTTNHRKIIVILQNIRIEDVPDEIVNISNDVCFIEMALNENEIINSTDNQRDWLKLKALLYLN